MTPCPRCGTPNDDNWPLDIDGKLAEGGCTNCWEAESDAEWWRAVVAIDTLYPMDSDSPPVAGKG